MTFTINPPNTPMVDGAGRPTAEYYRFFAQLQRNASTDISGSLAGAPFLTFATSPVLTGERVLTGGAGLTANVGPSFVTMDLDDTAVTPGTYGGSAVQLTVDQQGRITAISSITLDSDAIPEGTVNLYFTNSRARSALSGSTGISYNSSTGAIALANTAVTAASYGSASAFPTFTVDAQGRLTAASTLPLSAAKFDHYATVGNSGTTETDLYSDTIAAGQLGANGDKLEANYGGTFVSSGTATRQIKVYFAGTAILDTGALTLSLSSAWVVRASLIRVSSSVVRYMASLETEGAALAAYTSVGELTGLTLSGTNILKITGTAAGTGAASNDISALMGAVVFRPAA